MKLVGLNQTCCKRIPIIDPDTGYNIGSAGEQISARINEKTKTILNRKAEEVISNIQIIIDGETSLELTDQISVDGMTTWHPILNMRKIRDFDGNLTAWEIYL